MAEREAPTLSGVLRLARHARRLTTRQVGAMVGCSHVYVSEIERGVRPPSARLLTALAQAYGLDENELVQLMGRFTPAAVAYARRVPALAVLAHRLAVLEVSDEDIAVALAWIEQRALLRAMLPAPVPSAPVSRDEGVACQPRASMTKDVAVARALCMLHAGTVRERKRMSKERTGNDVEG